MAKTNLCGCILPMAGEANLGHINCRQTNSIDGLCRCDCHDPAKPLNEGSYTLQAFPSVQDTLAAREEEYGQFSGNSFVAQTVKMAFHNARGWMDAPNDVKEALDMIASKISRILSATKEKADSWHDIAGYATLIENRINKETK